MIHMNEDTSFTSDYYPDTEPQPESETQSMAQSGSQSVRDQVPQFAHLGSPRQYESHEVVGQIEASHLVDDPRINTIKAMNEPKLAHPSLSFKLIKNHTFNPTPLTYMIWGAIVVIIIISVMASVTQGFLLVKDRLFEKPNSQMALQNGGQNGANAGNTNTPSEEEEPRGSDDGKATSEQSLNFTPMYKVANADTIGNLGVTAQGYYVADIKTGERIMSKQANQKFPIASVTKLMTALVAYEKMDLQKVVVVSRDSYNAYGAQGELVPGEKIKLGDLMYPVLMESSNDGAEVISESYGRVEFMGEMNKKAAILGMTDTYYEDPSGLNPKNVSSSEDLFKLLKYIKEHAPILYDMTRVREFAILKHKWFNKNRFLNSDIFLGGKNGYIDESRWTTASIFDVTVAKGGKRQIAIVLLKSENREGDAMKLIRFLEKNVYFTETGSF
ncbi:MAG: hypothetical protein RIQ72_121 [Candidatus Parcubacteria bacterium]